MKTACRLACFTHVWSVHVRWGGVHLHAGLQQTDQPGHGPLTRGPQNAHCWTATSVAAARGRLKGGAMAAPTMPPSKVRTAMGSRVYTMAFSGAGAAMPPHLAKPACGRRTRDKEEQWRKEAG